MMFCPRCGERQALGDSRFCSRCGFLLTNVNDLLASGGVFPQQYFEAQNQEISTRRKGLKQGGKMILGGMILVPLLGMLSSYFILPEIVVALTALFLFWGGILRLLYAAAFEAGEDEILERKILRASQKLLNKKQKEEDLPSKSFKRPASYHPPDAGNWRDSRDFADHKFKK